MTTAYRGKGTLLKRGDGGSPTETFTTIATVLDIPHPQLAADMIDTTNQDSANGYKEQIPGLKSGGELAIEINYDPNAATHAALLDDFENQTLRNFKIALPSPLTQVWSFAAHVAAFQPKSPVAGKMTASIKLAVSGKPTLA